MLVTVMLLLVSSHAASPPFETISFIYMHRWQFHWF